MAKNELDLPGMIISARNTTTDDAEFARYAHGVFDALDRYNSRHEAAAKTCRDNIRVAIRDYGRHKNDKVLRDQLGHIYDQMAADNNSNAVQFNYELATELGQLQARMSPVRAVDESHAYGRHSITREQITRVDTTFADAFSSRTKNPSRKKDSQP